MKFCPRCGSRLETTVVETGSDTNLNAQEIGGTEERNSKCGCSSGQKMFGGTHFRGGREVCKRCGQPREPLSKEQKGFRVFIGTIATVVAILLTLGLVHNIQQRIERETKNNIAEVCLSEIQRVDSTVDRVVEVSDAGGSGAPGSPLDFTPVIENVKKGRATCDFDIDLQANQFTVKRVTWNFTASGAEKEAVITPGSPPKVSTETPPDTSPEPTQKAERSSNLTCSEAFRAAAAVPLSRTNDREVTETLYACGSVNEWWANAKRFPDAFGASYYADSELPLYVSVACSGNDAAPVCQEAFVRGYR